MFKDKLDKMRWSYTRLSSYEQCPYAFYLQYILRDEGDGNFFADSGLVMHKTLEGLIKGNIELDDAPAFFDKQWSLITTETKPEMMSSTYEKSMNYLTGLTGHELDGYEVLGVEKKAGFQLEGYQFVGFIDLLLRDKSTGNLVIVDHKSHKGLFSKKTGKPLKTELDTLLGYKRQLYLYSIPIIEQYQETPEKLAWNHFKTGELSVVPFDWSEYREAKEWALETIGKIYADEAFESNCTEKSFFYCNNLCGFRNSCEYLLDNS